MTELELKLSLPDQIANQAKAAGLLTSESIERLVREAIRKVAAQRLIEYGKCLREPGVPEITETVEAAPIEETALRDPDDAAVLACALAARAEVIVSGDADLHAFGGYQGIPVLSPADCLRRIAAR